MTDTRRGLAQLTGARKTLAIGIGAGALTVAGIGFAGSYAAVVNLARRKGFGDFAMVFPVGIDAGIAVLLALDLLLSWIRIPFPMLRHIAWLLTAATIAFNGAAAWPDPLGVGMHAVMPVLFVVVVEAVRHAVGRLADITADKHMDGVRVWRWLLAPGSTGRLWRRMKLWELRSYEQAVGMEQDRLIYQARLQAKYGRAWRRKAPVDAVLPLRLAKLGVPLTETAPAGLAAAGIVIEWRPSPPPLPAFEEHAVKALEVAALALAPGGDLPPDAPEAPSLRALLAGREPAFAAQEQPGRIEATARVPDEDMPECEDGPQVGKPETDRPGNLRENLHDNPVGAPPTRTGDVADQSTITEANPQVATACHTGAPTDGPGGEPTGAPETDEPVGRPETDEPAEAPEAPANPLAARNAQRAGEARARRREYALGWFQAEKDTPEMTRERYAEKLGVSRRTLARAITENTPA